MTATAPRALDVSVLYPSKYLKADDLRGKPVTVRITGIRVENVPMTGGKEEPCTVATMARTNKEWIVGKTNGYSLGVLFDRDIAHAIGKRVTLIADVDYLGKAEVPCIRVQGSPDATPERSGVYARAWKGKRVRGALVGRLKLELAKLTPIAAPPVEPEDVEEIDAERAADISEAEPDIFSDSEGPSNEEPKEEAPPQTASRESGED